MNPPAPRATRAVTAAQARPSPTPPPAAARALAVAFLLAVGMGGTLGCEGTLEVEPPVRTVRAVRGTIQLVGSGNATCSHGLAGDRRSGDRWCAFARPTAGQASTELWAINVSRALASQRAVACDGSSPHCRLLTSTLWDESPLFQVGHPYIHGFSGDTLIFYADARNRDPEEGYLGPVRAWRPGMAGPRQVTGPTGFSCTGQLRSDGVICLENESGFGQSLEFDLLAGVLGPGGSDQPLPRLRRIKPYGGMRRAPAWQVAFSPGGQQLLLSTLAPDMAVERLEMIASGQVGLAEPQEIARNLSRWEVSPDGTKLFYLAGYTPPPEGNGMGTLTVADFPTMANPVELEARVGAYQAYGPPDGPVGAPVRSVSLLQNVSRDGGTFRMIADISRPREIVTIAEGIAEPMVSPDLRYTVYEGLDDGVTYLAHNGGAGNCPLTEPGRSAFGLVFASAARKVFWMQTSQQPEGKITGWVADAEGCGGRRTFADKMAFLRATRTGLLYGLEEQSPSTMEVYYDPLSGPDAQPQLLAKQVDPQVVLLDDRYFVFTISGESPDAGLWIHGPLP